MNKVDDDKVRGAGMQTERIILQDGRYLVYYTFDASLSPGEKLKDSEDISDSAEGDV